jgi:3-oxoacyl-[acyl-carrier-protein] synthase-3
MIGVANGRKVGITGLGVHVPERVLTNDELATLVDTSDEWIMERTGIRERRIAADDEALTDIALPAARAALENAGVEGKDIDLLVCATVTPDMMFPTSSALLADTLGSSEAAAYDLLAGCTGFVYAVVQAYSMVAAGLSERALVVGGDVLSKILDWTDRSTLVLFGDGAGAVVLEPVDQGGIATRGGGARKVVGQYARDAWRLDRSLAVDTEAVSPAMKRRWSTGGLSPRLPARLTGFSTVRV